MPKDTQLIPVEKVGIIGAGTMGGGIAMNFLSAGIPVTILEMKQEALDRGTGVMGKNYEGNVKRGRISEEQAKAAMDRLSTTLDYADLSDCDLVIEAVFEDMNVKKKVFGQLDEHVKEGAILASNTSYLNVDEIAQATKRPGYVLGMHFFSPANVMKLLEVVRGAENAEGRARHGDGAVEEDRQGRGCRRRLRRLHRQPYAQPPPAGGEQDDHGGREALGHRPRIRRVRLSHGPVPDVGPRRPRHWLAPRSQPH